ncbi:hypothetical protein MRB53_010560 [Persea americana]|uniref:Uncharacterized protein n=1 Tax=Persea americana TaxID=3435 RepID=A0ACC2LSH5_PERAE|nr:hypothetical protein MRB53_010560 [Persea americana]
MLINTTTLFFHESSLQSKGAKRSDQPSNGCNLDIRSRQNDIQKTEENEDDENIKCYEAKPFLEFIEDVSHHATKNLTIDDGECGSVSNGTHEKAVRSDLQTSVSSEAVKPCGRINSCMVVSRDTLYIYGGMMEVRDREITLDDLYMLNLSKLDEFSAHSGELHCV